MSTLATLPGNSLAKAHSRGSARLLWRASWRHARQHRWQSWLSVVGIMLGVMMVVAVDLANSSARRAFDLSVATLSGTLTHQIVALDGGRVDDELFTRLRSELGIRASAPGLRGEVRLQGRRFTLLGIDPLSEAALERRRPGFATEAGALLGLGLRTLASARGVLMQRDAAAALQLVPGAEVSLRSENRDTAVVLAAVLEGADAQALEGVIVADIALAQEVLGHSGLDSIDLRLNSEEAERLRAWLPPAFIVVDAGSDTATLQQLSQAFQINLRAMSLLALLVAALLIYNTASLSVLERRATLGVLRALGVARGTLLRLVLGESAVLGLGASVAGAALGLLLGQVLVRYVTRTMDDLYFTLTVTRFLPDYRVLLEGAALGLGLTVAAALLPAVQAANAAPITLQRALPEEYAWRRRIRFLALLGVVLLGLGYVLLLPERGSLVEGFVALNCIVFGFCLIIPFLLSCALALVLALTLRHLPQTLRLSLRNIQSGIGRTGLAVAALTVAVSVTVGVGVMIGSFRHTINVWLEQTLSGEVQLARLDGASGIPPELERAALALPQLREVRRQYWQTLHTDFGTVRALAHDGAAADQLYLKQAAAQDLAAFAAGDVLLLAESFAWRHELKPGDTLRYQTREGEQSVRVGGLYFDYTTGTGALELPLSRFRQLWPEQGPQRLSFTLTALADRAATLEALRTLTQNFPGAYGVAANAEIKALTLAIFDRTFAITDVLRLLAILVAFVGVLSALTALQLQRMREYALLRASGMTVGETARMILAQTVAMGVCAGLLALPLGLWMSQVLIDVINRRSFGWSMQHLVPWLVLGQALVLAVIAALLAGLYPALRIRRLSPALALREA
ncbi:MAG: ABC transporter permease [Pseudomonadales bacterium]|jgi:putative ABC transport system permease protein|nr:ABC transporter permease [Pseudomonadales bacterium]